MANTGVSTLVHAPRSKQEGYPYRGNKGIVPSRENIVFFDDFFNHKCVVVNFTRQIVEICFERFEKYFLLSDGYGNTLRMSFTTERTFLFKFL